MRYYIIAICVLLALSVGSVSCGEGEPLQGRGQQVSSDNENSNSSNNNNNNENVPMSNNLKITIGSVSFNATLESNETTKEFKKLLPLTVKMSELNGNEKLFYLQNSLPTASFNPRTIQTGDLMLYGSTCVVLFYESFSTPYTYTRLGGITNPSGLASAVGTGSVNVTFEITD